MIWYGGRQGEAERASVGARVPDGHRIYAVGDIHGRADLLATLLEKIGSDRAARAPASREVLVFLGDYIDRGDDSKGVIDRLTAPWPAGLEPRFLMGNHEAMLIDFLNDQGSFDLWVVNGGAATMISYGLADLPAANLGEIRRFCQRFMHEALPASHRAFLEGLSLSVAVGDYFFVHAGVRPGVALADQRAEDMLWIREPFLSFRGDFGKVVVHGHTPAPQPQSEPNRIGLDTGAWESGRLTAVVLEGEGRRFLST